MTYQQHDSREVLEIANVFFGFFFGLDVERTRFAGDATCAGFPRCDHFPPVCRSPHTSCHRTNPPFRSALWKKLNCPRRNGTWSELAQARARRTGDSCPTGATTTIPRAPTCDRTWVRLRAWSGRNALGEALLADGHKSFIPKRLDCVP